MAKYCIDLYTMVFRKIPAPEKENELDRLNFLFNDSACSRVGAIVELDRWCFEPLDGKRLLKFSWLALIHLMYSRFS